MPALFKAQQAWREAKEEDASKVDKPIRVNLLSCMFREFSTRLAGFSSQPSTQETIKKLGWITDDSMDWCYLRCDAKSERLRPDTTREPLPHAKGIATVAAIHLLVSKTGPVTRFHPSRKMEETMRGATITFSMQLALFGDEAQQLRQYMYELTSCSITQLLKGPPAPMWPMRSRRRC